VGRAARQIFLKPPTASSSDGNNHRGSDDMALHRSTSLWRWPAAGCLAATAAIHMTLVPQHLRAAPYAGGLFIALSATAVAAAIVLMAIDHELVWLGAGALSLTAVLGYVLSRSVGLPSMSDDIGDWLNPLGVAAVTCEAVVAAICLEVLWRACSRRTALA
jgi:hypothetical protein